MRRVGYVIVALVGILALGASFSQQRAKLSDNKIVLAVLNDQSGVYADLSGKNSVEAVKMAVEDFEAKYGKNALGGPIEVISADHQNKPDLANAKAQEFYDRQGADVILDVPTSSAALAVAGVAKQKKRLYMEYHRGHHRTHRRAVQQVHLPLRLRHLHAG